MTFELPKKGQKAIEFKHFPNRCCAFIFRASEYFEDEKIASVLKTDADQVRRIADLMGLPHYPKKELWLNKGYITIIRRIWHLLPYDQILELLKIDEPTFAILLREEDFLDVKLGDKPICEPLIWQEPNEKDLLRLAEIKKIMQGLSFEGVEPFDFKYQLPNIEFSGKEIFKTRMIYAFSGLYQNAFEVDSRTYCSDEMLEAYSRLGVNGIWTQGVLYQLAEFPFEPAFSKGYEKRLAYMKDFADRLERFGMKLYLYINEPRSMQDSFYEKFPHLRGYEAKEGKICLCTSTKEVQDYLKDGIESVCRAVPNLGGFFTITRSENPTNCYSHSRRSDRDNHPCTCPRCNKRSVGEVIGEVVGCILEGARRVSKEIKVFAWSWAWAEFSEEIIRALPEEVILLSESELAIPYEIGGCKGQVADYSMSIVGPGDFAKNEWKIAKERGLEIGAKVQINTTWEASTVPSLPVFPSIEKHIGDLKKEGVEHLMLSWTLGGYPGINIAYAAKHFYERVKFEEENDQLKAAAEQFSLAFSEFPFHINTLYDGPQNGGPSNLLYLEPTGYRATMTCYAYDNLERWRSIYPEEIFEDQFARLCAGWEKGLLMLGEDQSETAIMAHGAYCLFKASLNQIRFIRARNSGDREGMIAAAREELLIAEKMLGLMNKNAAIGFEAANHYYFSKGQIAEKILNCHYILGILCSCKGAKDDAEKCKLDLER